MNLAAYDEIKEVDYNKSWINPRYRKLYSRELPYYHFHSFCTKYDKLDRLTRYYLVLHNDINSKLKLYPTALHNGVVKIRLYDVWDKIFKRKVRDVTNINLILEDSQEDCKVYYIDGLNLP